jgi:Protein of unknown function (DUF3489)
MSIKLTDTQLVMLSAAAMREDRCLTLSPSLRGAQVGKTGEKLIKAGLVREVKAKPSSPVWRRDDETGLAYALKLTAAGAKAIAVDDGEAEDETSPKDAAGAKAKSPTDPVGSPANAHVLDGETSPPRMAARTPTDQPRPGSKIAAVIAMLGRETGATIEELASTMGWLPHTTRAALTGLRRRGYVLAIDRSDRQRGSIYRIEAKPHATASETRALVPEIA